MKKLSIIIILLMGMIFPLKVQILKSVNVRDNKSFPNSIVITYVTNAEIFEVMEEYISYYKIKVISGSQKLDRVGWVWSGRLELNDNDMGIITEKGVTLRTEPINKLKYENGFIINGAVVEILDRKLIRYRIKGHKMSHFSAGWISASYCKVLE